MGFLGGGRCARSEFPLDAVLLAHQHAPRRTLQHLQIEKIGMIRILVLFDMHTEHEENPQKEFNVDGTEHY